MKADKVQIFGAAGAIAMTLGVLGAINAYVTQIQRSAPREVVQFEAVTVIGVQPRPRAAVSNPHVGEL